MNHRNMCRIRNYVEATGRLGAASLYFYLGYYSGMRYSVNHMRSLNPNPEEEPENIRILIELLPREVAESRFGAGPQIAMLKIVQLIFGGDNVVEPESRK